MRNISELLDLTYNPFVFLFVALLAYFIGSLVSSAFHFVFAPVFKGKIVEFTALGFKWEKKKTGKWEYIGHKPGLAFSAYLAVDLEKCGNLSSKQMKANESVCMILIAAAGLIVAVGVFITGLAGGVNIPVELLASAAVEFGLSYLVFAIIRVGVTAYVLFKINNKNSLSGYQQSAVSMIRAGVPFEKMELKSIPELHFKKATILEKKMYFPFYFMYLDDTEQFDKMAAAVGEVEQVLNPMADTRLDRYIYADLAYYYSTLYFDPDKAKDYYSRAGDSLVKDTESNSMRIKGFYELNCFGNVEKARECLRVAEEGIESFSIGSEREAERKLIARLRNAIEKFQG